MSILSEWHKAKTHCKNGHELSGDNIKKLSNGSGHRVCITCHRTNSQRSREKRRQLHPKRLKPTTEELFWAKVEKTKTCWLWTASRWGGKNGDYGQFKVGTKGHYAHRFAYELIKGPIPEGMQIDHLCRVRSCCNPDHLEPVNQRENLIRGEGFTATNSKKTHCLKGHKFTLKNTYWSKDGFRSCRHCRDLRNGCKKARLRLGIF